MQPDSPPFRFSLRSLLKAVLYIAIGLGVCRLATTPLDESVQDARRILCRENLKRIGVALLQYHEDYGRFPPPVTVDEHGKPMHSWRVLLCSYLAEPLDPNFPKQYDMSQSWDSAANWKVVHANPGWGTPYFCAESQQAPMAAFTNYVMIVGSQSAARLGESMSLDRIKDGPANTILVVEIAHSDILWTEPRDLSFHEMSFRVNDDTKPSVSSGHTHTGHGLAAALFADGTVKFLNDSIQPDSLRAMLTSAAGD